MAVPQRIKRRASGAAGAPAELLNAELAFNEVDDTLYYGKGTGGADGTATTVEPIAGKGAVVMRTGDQTVAGKKTFSGKVEVPAPTEPSDAATKKYVDDSLSGTGIGDMLKSEYDSDGDGKVNAADRADRVAWDGVDNKPTAFPPTAHNHDDRYFTETEVTDMLAGKAPVNSPNFTGTPTAPTPTGTDKSTKVATTAFVSGAIEALVGAAPEALDTLHEIAEALGNDPNFVGTIVSGLGGKLTKSANLSDLADTEQARDNLGLGTMAQQDSSNVAITGGTIDGIVLDGGTF